LEVFCFASDADRVAASLGDWFGDCEASLYGSPPRIGPASAEEEKEARPELDG